MINCKHSILSNHKVASNFMKPLYDLKSKHIKQI